MRQVDFVDGQRVPYAHLYPRADYRRIKPFNEKRFYMLNLLRIQFLAQFSGTRLLAMLYFADRASSPRYATALTWQMYAVDCAPGLTAKALERATEELLAGGHLQRVGVGNNKIVYRPTASELRGNLDARDFHRFTASERRWIAASLLSRGKRLKGPALLVYLWIAWQSENPTRCRYFKRSAYTSVKACASLNTFVQDFEECRPITTGAFKKAVLLLTQMGVVKELYAGGHRRFYAIRWPSEYERFMNANQHVQSEARFKDGETPRLYTGAREARKQELPAKALQLIRLGYSVRRLRRNEFEVMTPNGIVYSRSM